MFKMDIDIHIQISITVMAKESPPFIESQTSYILAEVCL